MIPGWKIFERHVTELLGLDATITSGNKFFDPGDAVTRGRQSPFPIFADAKYTVRASMSLRLKNLEDYAECAAALGKRFVLPIRFEPGWPFVGTHDYVVLSLHDFAELLELVSHDR